MKKIIMTALAMAIPSVLSAYPIAAGMNIDPATLPYVGNTVTAIPQVNSDWNALSGPAQIMNEPVIPAAQINSDWSAGSGVAGTVSAISYTNSGCTTGAQTVSDGDAGQSGTLIVGLGINQVLSAELDGIEPKNTWMKLVPVNTVGTPTFAIRTAQQEVLLP